MARAEQITPDMRMLADLLGAMRSMVNRGSNVRDAKVGPQDGVEADKDAVLGEIAFAKHFNVCPDLSLSPRSGSPDAVLKDYRIDVKTTRYKNGRLLATLKKNPDVDIYVLAILHDDHVKFPGWAYASDLCQKSRLTNIKGNVGYAMRQRDLRGW